MGRKQKRPAGRWEGSGRGTSGDGTADRYQLGRRQVLLALLGVAFGLVRTDELILVCAVTAAIGGIVGYGSNLSTSRQATADLKAAEARRAQLIDGSSLRPVE